LEENTRSSGLLCLWRWTFRSKFRRQFVNAKAWLKAIQSLSRRYLDDRTPRRIAQRQEEKKTLCDQGLEQKACLSLVTATIHAVCITRFDVKFIQSKLGKFTANPSRLHWLALLLEYSAFADDVDTKRSTVGVVFMVNGAPVSAISKLPTRPDSCINHSELSAFQVAVGPKFKPPEDLDTVSSLCSAMIGARGAIWLRGVKAALEHRSPESLAPTTLLVDNTGVLSMMIETTIKAANRHIYCALAETRHLVNVEKCVLPTKIVSNDNVANALTKQEPHGSQTTWQFLLFAGPSPDSGLPPVPHPSRAASASKPVCREVHGHNQSSPRRLTRSQSKRVQFDC